MGERVGKAKALISSFSSIDAGTHASSIAYYAFLSLVPLLALCISLVSLVGVGEQEVTTFFMRLVPQALSDLVRTIVGDAFERSGIAFSVSTLTLLWSASKGVKALRHGLNATYSMRETKSAVAVALISILAAIILGAMLAAVIYVVFSDVVIRGLSLVPSPAWNDAIVRVLNPVVMIALGTAILGVCYAYLPAGRRSVASQLPGALVATLGCGALSLGFRIYVESFADYTVLYGSIATVAMLLFWMYLASLVLLVGAFVNKVCMDAAGVRDAQRPGTGSA